MNNNLNFHFGMYEPATDSIIINTGENAMLALKEKGLQDYVDAMNEFN